MADQPSEDMRPLAELILGHLIEFQQTLEVSGKLPRLAGLELAFAEDERGVSNRFAFIGNPVIGDPGTVSVDCYQTIVNKAGIVGLLNQQSHDIEVE